MLPDVPFVTWRGFNWQESQALSSCTIDDLFTTITSPDTHIAVIGLFQLNCMSLGDHDTSKTAPHKLREPDSIPNTLLLFRNIKIPFAYT